jgi:hypothetical protein
MLIYLIGQTKFEKLNLLEFWNFSRFNERLNYLQNKYP